MKIALVQSYPVYHDGVPLTEWLERQGREQGMAGYLAGLGHEVEFWSVDRVRADSARSSEGGTYFFRTFPPDGQKGMTRNHGSSALLEHARRFEADLHLIKGVDGGVGRHLLGHYLVPEGREYALMCGGSSYGRFVPEAGFVFYQSEAQRDLLQAPRWRLWRTAVPARKLIFLPKAVDTDLFAPGPDGPKEWDVIVACRLVNRLKNLDALGPLSRHFRVAVAGTGPDEARLKEKYRDVEWLGLVPYRALPGIFRRARLCFHPGLREYVPRVVPEAMACGLPVIAFSGMIAPETVPRECGLLLPARSWTGLVADLLADETRLGSMGRTARAWVEGRMGRASFREALDEMLKRRARSATAGSGQ